MDVCSSLVGICVFPKHISLPLVHTKMLLYYVRNIFLYHLVDKSFVKELLGPLKKHWGKPYGFYCIVEVICWPVNLSTLLQKNIIRKKHSKCFLGTRTDQIPTLILIKSYISLRNFANKRMLGVVTVLKSCIGEDHL